MININDERVIEYEHKNTDKQFLVKKLNINSDMQTLIGHTKITLTEINGDIYFAKVRDEMKIINELLGQYYAESMDLDVVKYYIGKSITNSTDKVSLLSKSFIDTNDTDCNYLYANDLFGGMTPRNVLMNINVGATILPRRWYVSVFLHNAPETLIPDVLKLTVLDIGMHQIDRYSRNTIIKKIGDEYCFAPLFDFECSYNVVPDLQSHYYHNPFLVIGKRKKDFKKLAHDFPEILEFKERFLDTTSIEKGLEYIEENYPIVVSDNLRITYKIEDEKNRKLLQKIKK